MVVVVRAVVTAPVGVVAAPVRASGPRARYGLGDAASALVRIRATRAAVPPRAVGVARSVPPVRSARAAGRPR